MLIYVYIRIYTYRLSEMGKRTRVNLTIDEDVAEKAKSLGLNLSKTCENCLIRSIKALESTYGENSTIDCPENTQNNLWCGCRDLNPGYQRGRLMS